MELIRGAASDIYATNRVSSTGSGETLSVYTRFVATFSLSGRQVQIVGRQPPVVHAGDDVVVVGESDRTGIVRSICYVNVTRGVGNAEQGPYLWLLGGVLALLLSAVCLLSGLLNLVLSSDADGALLVIAAALPGLAFFPAGTWMLRRGRRIGRAIRMIHDASKKARSR